MTPLEQALVDLEAQIQTFNPGMKQQPSESSSDWFLLRALSLGRTYLRRCIQLELHGDAPAAERFSFACGKSFKLLDVPEAVVVARERLPDGTLPGGQA